MANDVKGMLAGAALVGVARIARRGVRAYRSGDLQDFVSKLGTGQALAEVRARFEEEDEQVRRERPRERARRRTPAAA